MCILCFLISSFLIYMIIGLIAGSIFNYKYKWKVDLNVSPEKFGACWPKYIPILISELKDEKKQSNRNIVLDTLDDIGYIETTSDKNSHLNINDYNVIKTGVYSIKSINDTEYEFKKLKLPSTSDKRKYITNKGKQYMVDTNGNILPLNYMVDINGNILPLKWKHLSVEIEIKL